MSVSDADIAFALELFEEVPRLSSRKMFGGLGLYSDGVIFGLISSDGTIYLKAIELFAEELRSLGSKQFRNMPYWSLPEQALDDPSLACDLALRAIKSLN